MTPTIIKAAPWIADQLDALQIDPEFLADDLMMDVCEQLCVALDDAGMKRKDLAERLGVSKSAISQLLGGDQNISLQRLVEVALAVGYRVEPPRLIPFERTVVETHEAVEPIHAEFEPPLQQTADFWKAACRPRVTSDEGTRSRFYVPSLPSASAAVPTEGRRLGHEPADEASHLPYETAS